MGAPIWPPNPLTLGSARETRAAPRSPASPHMAPNPLTLGSARETRAAPRSPASPDMAPNLLMLGSARETRAAPRSPAPQRPSNGGVVVSMAEWRSAMASPRRFRGAGKGRKTRRALERRGLGPAARLNRALGARTAGRI